MSNQFTATPSTPAGDLFDLTVPLLGGTLLGYCFLFPAIAWMAPFGLGALAYSAYIQSRSIAVLSALVGLFAFHLIGLQILPQAGHREIGQWWPPYAFAVSVVSLFFLPVTRLLTGRIGLSFTWSLPIAWAAAEQLKYWVTVPFLDITFPLLRVGATLHQQPNLLRFADVVGGSGLSWLVAVFASLVADCLTHFRNQTTSRPRLFSRFLFVSVIGCVAISYGLVRGKYVQVTPGPTIGLISDLFPVYSIDNDVQMITECERLDARRIALRAGKVDLWIWSEMSLAGDLIAVDGVDSAMGRWDHLHKMCHVLNGSMIIGAGRTSGEHVHHNSCYYISEDRDESGFYDKHFLCPCYEFQPTLGLLFSKATGHKHLDPESLNRPSLTPGAATPLFWLQTSLKDQEWSFGTSICYDIWFSDLFRRYMRQSHATPPDFFVNIADEVFTGGEEFSYGHWALVEARLRAIETRRTMVRNCGDGFSAVISPSGELLDVEGGASDLRRLIVNQIPISCDVTVFSLFGDWVTKVSFAISVWVLLVTLVTRRKSHSSVSTLPAAEIPVGYEDLSILVPAFNEAGTIQNLLQRVRRVAPNAEIIVVNDASTDGTGNVLNQIASELQIKSLFHEVNRGKGAAIRTGLTLASRRFTIIQDSDEEYCPDDYEQLVRPLRSHEAAVVYGSRYLPTAEWRRPRWRIQDLAITGLNWMVLLLYGERLTDEATCYKVFDTRLLKSMDLKCEGFEFCPEVTAKALRSGHAIAEVPIRYSPRTYAEGKKIRWTHALSAAWTLVKWRFFPFRQSPSTVVVAPPTKARADVSR